MGEDDRDEFEIWPECVNAVEVFLACATQWKAIVAPDRLIYQGIDYAGLNAVMEMVDAPDRKQLFADVRTMELAALDVLNNR